MDGIRKSLKPKVAKIKEFKFVQFQRPRPAMSIFTTKRIMSRDAVRFVLIGALSLNIVSAGIPALLATNADRQKHSAMALDAETLSSDFTENSPAADAKLSDPKIKAEKISEQLDAKLSSDRDKMLKGKQRDRRHVQALDEGRTETDRVYLNADGTKSLVRSFQAKNFKDKAGKWKDIDASVAEDKASGKWRTKSNAWDASFGDASNEGVEIINNGQSFVFGPIGAKSVKPVVTGEAPDQRITYRNVWQGIDLQYEVAGSQVKESIIVKSKAAATSYAFNTKGASLTPSPDDPESFTLGEAFSGFRIAAPTVDTADGKVIADGSYVTQTATNGQLNVELDANWLKNLGATAFPVVIDPTLFYFSGTNYSNVRSDTGLSCTGAACPGNAVGKQGSVNWRSIYQTNFGTDLVGKFPIYAELHLEMLSGASAASTIYVNRATCTNAFACYDSQWGEASASVGTIADIDVTNIYRGAIGAANYNPAVMLRGVETGGTDTYKLFDHTKTEVTIDFEALPTQSVWATGSPANGGVSVNTQPTFFAGTSTDPDTSGQILYRFIVGSSGSTPANDPFKIQQGVTGVVANSGLSPDKQWTVSDGTLRDGTTYYWQIAVWDSFAGAPEVYSPLYSFRVDQRNGKDTTQAFDTVGTLNTDLATGNLTTSTSTHSITALGGDLGVTLDYNSPQRSRQGIVGEYFNDPTASRVFPAANVEPNLRRVDPDINFNWGSGTPYAGMIDTNNYLVRWTGYFVAPQTKTFQFGTTSDDGVRIYVNDVLNLNEWATNPTNVFGTGVALTAGQTAKITYEYFEGGGLANTQFRVKTTDGAIAAGPVQSGWLQTGVRPIGTPKGLVGRYFTDSGSHTFPANLDDPNFLFLTRTDSSLSQNWGTGSPVPNGPVDNFMVRWKGYFLPPVTGNYTFGVNGDDGSRVYINGSSTPTVNNWTSPSLSPVYAASPTSLTANTPVEIVVEYYEGGGAARFSLLAKRPGQSQTLTDPTPYLVETNWLTPQAQVLPDGWNLGIDANGSLSYHYAVVNQGSVTLRDSIGQSHEYKFVNGAFVPQAGESGRMVRNADGTVTLQDEDGKTYVFDLNGTLKSVTTPVDDRNPAGLLYTYGGSPVHLQQVTDGVNSSRWVKIAYTGDPANVCPAPAATANPAPSGMICGVTTSDGQVTKFGYQNDGGTPAVPRLGRLEYPGGQIIDYGYELTSGRINRYRDSLAYDAIVGGQRAADNTVMYEISYDALGRVGSVTMPAATASAVRQGRTYEYQAGYTNAHFAGATEPNGFSRKVVYDATFRTTDDVDAANLTTHSEWHPTKDLVLWATDQAGLKSTILYDYADRPTDQYGPAPSAWFNSTTLLPLTSPTDYTPQIPHNQIGYDEGINGLAAAYYNVESYTNGTGQPSKALFGNPKLHGTGVGPANGDVIRTWGGTPPFTPDPGKGWGVRLSGWMRFAANGTYTFKVKSDDGARLWVDDQLLINGASWADGPYRTHATNTINISCSPVDCWKKVQLDYYNKAGDTDAQLELLRTAPSGSETNALGSLLKPGYDLVTTQKTFDSNGAVGDSVTTTSYGSNPELGLAQTSTVDPTGLNLVTTNTYETQGASGTFLRQTAKFLPGANTGTSSTGTQYTYYTATDTRDNPCTTGAVEAFKQAGRLKLNTTPDPDGAGAQTPVVTETVYDDAGRIVAARFNTEAWRCTTYDSRGRVSQVVIPAQANTPHVVRTARTINYSYSSGGSPFQTSISDSGSPTGPDISIISDLLGRTTNYNELQKVSNNYYTHSTNYTFDNLGRLSTRVSGGGTFITPVTETYTYDNFNRVSNYQQNSVNYATPTYDAYSRSTGAMYPAAGPLAVTMSRDSLGRTNNLAYTIKTSSGATPTQITDTITLSQSGQVLSGTENGATKTYTYDKAGRLTNATLGANTFAYAFGAPTTCTGTYNANAGKNANRTSSTINGANKTYCYNNSDRLISSSDTNNFDTVTYDAHGNISSGSSWTKMEYDSSDRAAYVADLGGSQTTAYDPFDRPNYSSSCLCYYAYGSSGSAANWTYSSDGSPNTGFFQLPGNVQMTQKVSMGQRVYSLPNLHGDTMVTTDQVGVLTSPTGTFQYDPFGKVLGSGGFNTPPNASGSDSMAYLGQYGKLTSTNTENDFVQMGARLYIPTLGRFSQMDPVEGGTENNYVYPSDPVNGMDLDGSALMVPKESRDKIIKSWCGEGAWVATCFVPGFGQIKQTGRVVKLSQGVLEHIIKRHWFTSGIMVTSKFSQGTTGRQLKGMIETATKKGVRTPNTQGRPGSIYTYNVGRTIGASPGGKPTSVIKVVVDTKGNVVTAYPY